ncbi:hypothetical protein X777_02287 [Ooceraea biroi]|uniref:Uncharacterized protein n=1 Tax=Ooceraea biroi TaxID=2015173 RepID=A0A026WL71_OOCBI|nr:hypothetical protein X777_02287 [Ooceraea biroi]
MHIVLDDENIELQQFLVCEFYGRETCFCWSPDKLVIFPYTKEGSAARDTRVLSTPGSVRKIQWFSDYDGRVFMICTPQGAYKLSRNSEFALLSKNALAMGAEYWEVIVAYRNGVYLDNKQSKSSRLLFQCSTTSSEVADKVHALPLALQSTETQFVNCLVANWEAEQKLCVLAHHRKLFVLRGDAVQLIYMSDITIVNTSAVKRGNKVAGVLLHLVDADTVILVYGKNDNLAFEKVHLGGNGRNTLVLCAGFSLQTKNVIWILYCDQFRMYYVRKELSTKVVQQTPVDERTFRCIQHYRSDVILGLSQENELVEFSLEKFESSLLASNDVGLCTSMFQRTDLIMEKICAKVKQLDVLYESLAVEQDRLRRINMYASKQRLKIKPDIKVSRMQNYRYLTLSIDKLPKNSHVVFTFLSKNRNVFCIKEIRDTKLTIEMPINEDKILCSSTVGLDLITLMDKQHPWCLITDFINYSLQDYRDRKRKIGPKRDKTVFIDTKITSLRNLIEDKDLSMAKLCEIKEVIRKSEL